MVQILPYVPSFGEKLAPVLGEAIGKVGQGFQLGAQRKSDALKHEILGDSNRTLTERIKAFQGLSPDAQKSISPIFGSMIKQEMKDTSEKSAESRKTEKKREHLGGVLDELESLKEYAGSTKVPFTSSFQAGPGGLNRTGIEKRASIGPLALTLEGVLRDMTTKGTLAASTFERLVKEIPNEEMSEREYQGKINGFRKILESEKPEVRKAVQDNLAKKTEKQSLTPDLAGQFLEKAGGDKTEARKLAKEAGYDF
jgi:hypothetical protein